MQSQLATGEWRRERKSKPVYANVQALRAVAALMVVLAHLSGFELKAFGADGNWLGFLHDIGATGVDIFFAISGFIMVATTQRVQHSYGSARTFLWRRATRVYPPYLIITAAIFALYLVKPGLVNSSQETPPDPIASFLLLPQDGLPLLLVGWTLVFEMYFYLIFALGLLAPKSAFPFVIGGWGLVTLALSVMRPEGNVYLEFLANPLHFEFIYGAVIGYLITRGVAWMPRLVTAVGLVGSALIWALMASGGFAALESNAVRVATIGLTLAVALYGFIGLEERGEVVFPAWLTKLGASSYSLYLTHVLTIATAGAAIALVPKNDLTHVLSLGLVLGACVLGGLLYYRLVEDPITKALHKRKQRVAA